MPRHHAFLFDMDGLLLDTERLAKQAFDMIYREAGLAPDAALFRDLIGRPSKEGRRILDTGLPPALPLATFEPAWEAAYAEATRVTVPVRPQIKAALSRAAAHGPLIVATSSRTSRAEDKLERAGLRGYFTDLIGGDQVTNGKPAPEIFERAAGLAGVAPSDCAAFEDSENGVRSAHAAGCFVVQVPDLIDPSPELLALGHRVAPDLLTAVELTL